MEKDTKIYLVKKFKNVKLFCISCVLYMSTQDIDNYEGKNIMKKQFLSLTIMFSILCGLCACGADKAPTIITIEGKSYDLSGDFQEVVGNMVKDDLQVVSAYSNGLDYNIYDEDGKIDKNTDFDKDEPYIYAIERSEVITPDDEELGCLIQKMYLLDANAEFNSIIGFNSDSKKKDIKNLGGFMECVPVRMRNSDAYGALFVDGKAVDFSEYEDDYEEWKEMLDEEGYKRTFDKFFPKPWYPKLVCRIFYADFMKMSNTYDEFETRAEEVGISLKEEIMLAFAMQDACERLEDEEIESLVSVKVEVTEEDDIIMEYIEFYFDAEWDDDKFRK